MKNIDRILYVPDLDVTKRIDQRLIRDGRIILPTQEQMVSLLEVYVKEVIPQNPGGVFLKMFLTNTFAVRAYGGWWGVSLGVFPERNDFVDYELCRRNFFVNIGTDPIVIQCNLEAEMEKGFVKMGEKGWQSRIVSIADILLFRKDPFTHLKKYPDFKEILGLVKLQRARVRRYDF